MKELKIKAINKKLCIVRYFKIDHLFDDNYSYFISEKREDWEFFLYTGERNLKGKEIYIKVK